MKNWALETAIVVMLLLAGQIRGNTVSWTGAGTASWSDASSWSALAVPGPLDTAVFTDAGLSNSATIALGATQRVSVVDMGGGKRFTIGSAADITLSNKLQISALVRTNATSTALTNTIAADILLDAAQTVFTPGTNGLLYLTGYLQDLPAVTNGLVVQGPGIVYQYLRENASSTATFKASTIVKDDAELRIYCRNNNNNPQTVYFGVGAITLTNNSILSLRAAGGSNAGINNNININGTGTISSAHSYVSGGAGRSCNLYGNVYLNGMLTLSGTADSVFEGTNSPTLVAYNKTLYVGQTNTAARCIFQTASAGAPNRNWMLWTIADGTGSAVNPLQLQNLSPSGLPLYLNSPSSTYSNGTIILDDGVAEDLVGFANSVESVAKNSGAGAGNFGKGFVQVDAGALLVLRYNQRQTTDSLTYVGVDTKAQLIANGTVFLGCRGVLFGTTNSCIYPLLGNLCGTGKVVLSQAAVSIGNDNRSTNFAGRIVNDLYANAASNMVVKVGSGTWTLTGSAEHGGGTLVSNGTLRIDGTLKHAGMSILAGATCDGAGTIQVHLAGDKAETISCAGTLNITQMTVTVVEDIAATSNQYVIADCTAGSLVGTRFASSLSPVWASRVNGSQIIIVRRKGSVILLR